MGNVVINAFGGEGTLFTRAFLAALPAWPWKNPSDTVILLRWLDLANNAEGTNGETDAAKTANMRAIFGKNAATIARVFGAPMLMTAAPDLTTGENNIAAAYTGQSDAALLELQFTKAEQIKSHEKGFQGDPCAGTACIRGQKNPLPAEFYDPKRPDNGSQIAPQVWITVGGFRGGGCATTLVPIEAEERQKTASMQGVTSVLIAALPYSSHEEDPNDEEHTQLKSDFAFSGTRAILSGGFDITNWAKRYFVSSFLKDGKVFRPVTAGYNVDDQNTTLIATNLITADCAYRAIEGLDADSAFDGGKVYIPVIDKQIQNAFGYHLGVDINRMRALCWFAAAVKELHEGWEQHNRTAQHNAQDKQVVADLKAYCDLMVRVFYEMQTGRYPQGADTKAMPFAFMPESFFINYFKRYETESWWEAMVIGNDKDKSDDFHTGLFSSDYKTYGRFSNRVLSDVLEKNKQDIGGALEDLFKRFLKDAATWGYAKANGSNAGDGSRLMFPMDTAMIDNMVAFGTSRSPAGENSVIGAVKSESDKNNWNGFIGGPCGRLYDFGTRIEEANESDPMVVKYTSLLLSLFLRDLREIPIKEITVRPTVPDDGSNTIFTEMKKHLNYNDGIHIYEVDGIKVCSLMQPKYDDVGKVTEAAYFLLPTPGTWGADAATGSYEHSAWTQLVGFDVQNDAAPADVNAVLADLTAFEVQIVYTMLYAINHYDPEKTGQIITTEGSNGNVHPRFTFAKKLLETLEKKTRILLERAVGNVAAYPHAAWEKMDYDEPVCKFIVGQVFHPNKFFAKKLVYYRMEKTTLKSERSSGIYCAYPFADTGAKWLEAFAKCSMFVKADLDQNSGDAKKITVKLTFTRTGSQIEENRSFVYEQQSLVRMKTPPAISMVPQFLGYTADQKPRVVYRYLWTSFQSDLNQQPCTVGTADPMLTLMFPELPNPTTWKLCQKKQRVASEKVDAAWSAVSEVERSWWNICNSKDEKQRFGCLGKKPILLLAKSPSKEVPLTRELPTQYKLEMYFDFGTANSHMDVYVKDAADGFLVATRDETAFMAGSSEYYLTLDLTNECVNEQIIRLHEENMTPTADRRGTIPTMIQAYGQPDLADQEYVFSSGAAQYDIGRIVYPLKETMNRIYTFAMGKKNEAGEPIEKPRSLAELGFCDQMKIASGNAIADSSLPAKREFFMRGFIQNVVAMYYTRYHAWPMDIQLYCSYPTDALREQYFSQLVQMLPSINNLTNFYSEAISFVCYDGENGSKVKKDSVTIDIGAGTTDIALCRYNTETQKWMLEKTASLQFAGMRIVEQSIIESLKFDKVDIASVFSGLDQDRIKLLNTLLNDPTQTESLRMLIRNLISDGYIQQNTSVFDERLRVRMVMRTVGLLLAVKELLGSDWGSYELYLHGGPIASLKSINLKRISFARIVELIFGKTPSWDSNKAAITVGMSNIVHASEPLVDDSEYEQNMLERGWKTVFNSPTAVDVHNFQYDSCDIRPLAEEAIKAFSGISANEDKTLDDVAPFSLLQKDKDIRGLVEKIVSAKTEFTATIQQEITKCQYYDGMDPRLLTMYAIDNALTKTTFDTAKWK